MKRKALKVVLSKCKKDLNRQSLIYYYCFVVVFV